MHPALMCTTPDIWVSAVACSSASCMSTRSSIHVGLGAPPSRSRRKIAHDFGKPTTATWHRRRTKRASSTARCASADQIHREDALDKRGTIPSSLHDEPHKWRARPLYERWHRGAKRTWHDPHARWKQIGAGPQRHFGNALGGTPFLESPSRSRAQRGGHPPRHGVAAPPSRGNLPPRVVPPSVHTPQPRTLLRQTEPELRARHTTHAPPSAGQPRPATTGRWPRAVSRRRASMSFSIILNLLRIRKPNCLLLPLVFWPLQGPSHWHRSQFEPHG